jgi:hypothetical protein
MTRRVREIVGEGSRPCGLCGSTDVVLVRSHTVGNLLERVLGRVDPDERTTATCRSCGSRAPLPVRPSTTAGPRPLTS